MVEHHQRNGGMVSMRLMLRIHVVAPQMALGLKMLIGIQTAKSRSATIESGCLGHGVTCLTKL